MTPSIALSVGPRPRRAGFTLIELLTVIAIIGILAAVIIPVVGKVRTSAKRTQGLSNLRQVVVASLTYAQDNRGRWFPNDRPEGGVFYAELITQYALKIPGTNRHELFHDPLLPYDAGNLHFAPIGIYFKDLYGALVHYNNFNNIKAPAKTVFFADNWSNKAEPSDWEMPYISNVGAHTIWDPVPAFVSAAEGNKVPQPGYGTTQGEIDMQRDPGQAKLGFFDGHVAIFKRQQMKFSLFDPRYQ
jgi:prepilin-type N-terminal cleavage/methylation domain-containing protein